MPPPLATIQNDWPASESRERRTPVLTPIPRYFLPPDYFVYASPGALTPDIHNMCIVTPGQDLTKIPVPESLREMVLARFDRLPPLEKVVLKCASILGDSFPSDLVASIVPKSAEAQVDLVLYHLLKVGMHNVNPSMPCMIFFYISIVMFLGAHPRMRYAGPSTPERSQPSWFY